MSNGRGEFFAIDRRQWARVCQLGMNEAVAYLVLACGTGRDNRITSWSSQSLHQYTGIAWTRGKAAIENLIEQGFLSHHEAHTRERPRYEFASFESHEDVASCNDELIWLPNSIITGTSEGEMPPVYRLRSRGDIWVLRLFIDLYHSQNLMDDGGISPSILRGEYSRKRVGEQGPYVLWGFRFKHQRIWFSGPFEAHEDRPKPAGSDRNAVWQSLHALQEMGLLFFVPHLYENSSNQGEIIHPYGIGEKGEEPMELEIGNAAERAAHEMSEWNLLDAEREGFAKFCPVIKTLPDVQMIGIARLRYRPRTSRTAAWWGQLKDSAETWIKRYRELAEKAKLSHSEKYEHQFG